MWQTFKRLNRRLQGPKVLLLMLVGHSVRAAGRSQSAADRHFLAQRDRCDRSVLGRDDGADGDPERQQASSLRDTEPAGVHPDTIL